MDDHSYMTPGYTPEQAAAECSAPLHAQAVIGIEHFNRGEYFEAHEYLEMAWRSEPAPARELYRGILQVAVAYYHLKRGNYVGAVKLLERALGWLAPFPGECRGIQVESLRRDARRVQAEVLRLGPEGIRSISRQLFSPVVWKSGE